MPLPLGSSTTYTPSAAPSIKAQDLNDLQTYLSGLYDGYASIGGLIINGTGGASLAVRAATQALLRFEDGAGHARGLIDYLGFRSGPVLETYDHFLNFVAQVGAVSNARAYTPGGWSVYSSTNTTVQRWGTAQGTNLFGTWPNGALELHLSSSRTSSDYAAICTPFLYNSGSNSGSSSYILNNCVYVFEWAFCFHNTISQAEHFMGLTTNNYAAVDPLNTTNMKLGLRYAPDLASYLDTTIKLMTNDGVGSGDHAVDTGITPVANTIYRCRLELHRSATPLGARARLFVNGTMAEATANLPITTSAPGVDSLFQFSTKSNSAGANIAGLEIGYWKSLLMPIGNLTAGATTSDV